jgi:hypothetical protein
MDFTKALSTKIADVEPPKLPPIGTYIFQITKLPTTVERHSEKGDWDVVDVPCVAVEAGEDVDPEELAAFGQLKNFRARVSFLFDKNDENAFQATLNRMATFYSKHVGLGDQMDLKEAMNAGVNQRFRGSVQHQPRSDTGDLQANITKTAPVE